MNATRELGTNLAESAEEQRERRLQPRRERERSRHASETAEQREDRLSRWRIRDRVQRTAQSVQQRQQYLQCRHDWLPGAESPKEREARLHQRRDRLAAESTEEIEARLHWMRDRLAPSLLKREKPGYIG